MLELITLFSSTILTKIQYISKAIDVIRRCVVIYCDGVTASNAWFKYAGRYVMWEDGMGMYFTETCEYVYPYFVP